MNILIAPATTGIGKEIAKSLRSVKNVNLFGSGFDALSAKKDGFRNFTYIGPNQTPDSLMSSLFQIVRDNDIEAVFIAHDQWMRDLLSIKLPQALLKVLVNLPAQNCLSLFSKLETYKSLSIPELLPRIYNVNSARESLPIFIKPDIGQGSRDTMLVTSQQEFEAQIANLDASTTTSYVFSEYLPGPEFTVDCFSAKDSSIIFCQGRVRSRTVNGVSVETWRVSIPGVHEWAQLISTQYSITGSWFFQLKESDSGDLKLLEIGLRIAGASGINRLYGLNMSLMDLYQHQGKSISILHQDYGAIYCQTDKTSVIKRGINSAYFDFDDTIIVNGMANDKVIQSILDLHDKGIPIKILTRNSNELTEKLVSLHLNDVVGEVIYVPALDKKSLYIFTNEPFLFVDDSHRERLDVHNQFLRLGVVLDPSAFENKIVFES